MLPVNGEGREERDERRRRPLRSAWTGSLGLAMLVVTTVVCLQERQRGRGSLSEAGAHVSFAQGISDRVKQSLMGNGWPRGPRNMVLAEGLDGVPEDMIEMMDFNADPCEDPYRWACGAWDKNAIIPDYVSGWSPSFDQVDLDTMSIMRDELQEDKGPPGQYWRSCMNTSRLDKLGPKALWDTGLLQSALRVTDKRSLTDFLIDFSVKNDDALFSWWIAQDDELPDQHMASLSGGPLSLPDRSYYLDESESMQAHRKAFIRTITTMYKLVGPPAFPYGDTERVEQAARDVLRIETAIARITLERSEARKQHPQYVSVRNLTDWCPSVEWHHFFKSLNLTAILGDNPSRRLGVYNPAYFEGLEVLLSNSTFLELSNYLLWRSAHKYAPYLASDFVDAMIDWNADLYGISQK